MPLTETKRKKAKQVPFQKRKPRSGMESGIKWSDQPAPVHLQQQATKNSREVLSDWEHAS